jgi:hypothetical protein
MTRQSRTILIMAVMSVVAVAVLVILARRYGRLFPSRGPEFRTLPASAAPSSEPTPPTDPQFPSEVFGIESPPPVNSPTPAAAAPTPKPADEGVSEVDGFFAARRAIKDVVEQNYGPVKARKEHAPVPHARLMEDTYLMSIALEIRKRRDKALESAKMPLRRYKVFRDAYHEWIEGRPPKDAAIGAAFDGRRAEADTFDLGPYDPLDF